MKLGGLGASCGEIGPERAGRRVEKVAILFGNGGVLEEDVEDSAIWREGVAGHTREIEGIAEGAEGTRRCARDLVRAGLAWAGV